MMAKRDKYLRKFNRTRSLDMKFLYIRVKNEYYAEHFTKHKTNMKMLLSGIRSIINSKSNTGSSISCLTHNGVKVDDSKQMANIFNNVFVNTAKKKNENIPRTKKSPLEYFFISKRIFIFYLTSLS